MKTLENTNLIHIDSPYGIVYTQIKYVLLCACSVCLLASFPESTSLEFSISEHPGFTMA